MVLACLGHMLVLELFIIHFLYIFQKHCSLSDNIALLLYGFVGVSCTLSPETGSSESQHGTAYRMHFDIFLFLSRSTDETCCSQRQLLKTSHGLPLNQAFSPR